MISPQTPFNTVRLMTTTYDFDPKLCAAHFKQRRRLLALPVTEVGNNKSNAENTSSAWHKNAVYLPITMKAENRTTNMLTVRFTVFLSHLLLT